MKITKILLSTLSVVSLALAFSACGSAPTANAPVNNSNKSNAASGAASNQPAVNKTAPAVNAANSPAAKSPAVSPSPAAKSEANKIEGELQTGKTESLILYVGMDTGDYAAYCFDNDSEAGRAISAACKNGDRCEVGGEVAPGKCAVPGLEADLSDSGRIVKVTSAKSLGPKKQSK